jgi:DNA-binding transcriptional LysR family regulator
VQHAAAAAASSNTAAPPITSGSQVELTEAIIEMVKVSLGIAVLARWAVGPHLGVALMALPLTRSGFRRRWYAVTPDSRSEPEYRKAFIELLAGDGIPFA